MDIILIIIIIGSIVVFGVLIMFIGAAVLGTVCKGCICGDKRTSHGISRSHDTDRRNSSGQESFIGNNGNMYPDPFSIGLDNITNNDSEHEISPGNDCSEVPESHSHHGASTSDNCTVTLESHSNHDTGFSDNSANTFESPSTYDTGGTSTCDTSTYD